MTLQLVRDFSAMLEPVGLHMRTCTEKENWGRQTLGFGNATRHI